MSVTAVEDLPADLVGEIIDVLPPRDAMKFVASSAGLSWKAGQTIAPWEKGGLFAERLWSFSAEVDVALLEARNDFLARVAEHQGDLFGFDVRFDPEQKSTNHSILVTLTHVTRLDFTDCAALTDTSLAHAGAWMRLKELNLSGCVKVSSSGLACVSKSCRELVTLTMRSCDNVGDQELLCIAEMSKLTYLDITNCRAVTSKGLRHIARCQQLETLLVEGCDKIASSVVVPLSKLRKLKMFSFSRFSPLDDACCEHLSKCTDLTSLDFSGIRVTKTGLEHLATQLLGLRFLHLNSDPHLHFDLSARIGDVAAAQIARMKCLTSVLLPRCDLLTDVGVALLATLPELEALSINSCTRVTNAGVAHIAGMRALTDLDIGRVYNITDACADSLAAMTKLTSLNVEFCSRLSDTCVVTICPALANLRTLNVDGLRLSGSSLLSIGKELRSLSKLSANYSRTFSDDSLAYLANSTALQELSLRSWHAMSDVGVAHVCRMKTLRILNLAANYDLSDACGAHIAQLNRLERLTVGGCYKLSDGFLVALAPLIPSLKAVDAIGCSRLQFGPAVPQKIVAITRR